MLSRGGCLAPYPAAAPTQAGHCQAPLNGHRRVQLRLRNVLSCEYVPIPANICSDIGTAFANIPASEFSALLEYSWEVNVKRGTSLNEVSSFKNSGSKFSGYFLQHSPTQASAPALY